MSKKKPTYQELEKKLVEVEKLLASMQRPVTKINKSESDIAGLNTEELARAYISSEQNFKNTTDECPLGIRIVTEEGALIYANKAALKIFGYHTVEELAAMKRSDLYTPESYAAHQERKRKRKLQEHIPAEYEVDIRRPDGEIRNLIIYRQEVMWGGERQFMALYEDSTERKRAEVALKESE